MVPEAPAVVDIDVELEEPNHPEGNVQVYEVAPETKVMKYP